MLDEVIARNHRGIVIAHPQRGLGVILRLAVQSVNNYILT